MATIDFLQEKQLELVGSRHRIDLCSQAHGCTCTVILALKAHPPGGHTRAVGAVFQGTRQGTPRWNSCMILGRTDPEGTRQGTPDPEGTLCI